MRPLRRLGEVARLQRGRDAEEPVGRVRLVAVLGQPDSLPAERVVHVPEEAVDRRERDRLAVGAAAGRGRLEAPQRIGIVRIGVELGAGAVHAANEVDRRDAAVGPARGGDSAGHLRASGGAMDGVVGGIEQRLRVDARRGRAKPAPLVRLVPDQPVADERIAIRHAAREACERPLRARRPVGRAAAVRPARRAPEGHDRDDPAAVEAAQDRVGLLPVGSPSAPRSGSSRACSGRGRRPCGRACRGARRACPARRRARRRPGGRSGRSGRRRRGAGGGEERRDGGRECECVAHRATGRGPR